MVREFQRVIGDEARQQCRELLGRDPDLVVACVGGGSNAAGTFAGFVGTTAQLVGVEAAGGAAMGPKGVPGVLHGMKSYLLQDELGQILEAHSISAGLDYPGIGPEHAHLAAHRPRPLRLGHRRRGPGRSPVAGPQRGHHPGPGAGPRPGLAGQGGEDAAKSRPAPRSCSPCRGAGTRTPST